MNSSYQLFGYPYMPLPIFCVYRFSPIMNLDSYVADWAYAELKEQHEVETGCLSCSKFPKRSDVKITVNWSKVDFKHSKLH